MCFYFTPTANFRVTLLLPNWKTGEHDVVTSNRGLLVFSHHDFSVCHVAFAATVQLMTRCCPSKFWERRIFWMKWTRKIGSRYLAQCNLEVAPPRTTSRALQASKHWKELKGYRQQRLVTQVGKKQYTLLHSGRSSAAVEGKVASDSMFSDTEMTA
jgi:hypothetical protein